MSSTSADREYWKNNILNRLDAIDRRLKALERRTGVSAPSSGASPVTAAGDPVLADSPFGAATRLYLHDSRDDTWWKLYVDGGPESKVLRFRRIRKEEVV